MNSHSNIDQWIAAFVDGTISHGDFEALEQWTLKSDANALYARQAIETLFSARIATAPHHYDASAAYHRFLKSIGSQHLSPVTQHPTPIIISNAQDSEPQKTPVSYLLTPNLRKWLVAAVLLIAALPVLTYFLTNTSIESRFQPIAVEAPEGSQLIMTLPDGTRVKLNPGSRISYSQGFGITDRELTLSGEAFFTVKPAKKHLVVSTPEMAVSDISTEFSVRNYADEATARVSLYEGKVEISDRLRDKNYALDEGNIALMNKKTGKVKLMKIDDTRAGGSSMDELLFEDADMLQVARELSRAYGIRIQVADTAGRNHFYGTFHRKTQTIEEILSDISRTRNISYRKHAGGYLLY